MLFFDTIFLNSEGEITHEHNWNFKSELIVLNFHRSNACSSQINNNYPKSKLLQFIQNKSI